MTSNNNNIYTWASALDDLKAYKKGTENQTTFDVENQQHRDNLNALQGNIDRLSNYSSLQVFKEGSQEIAKAQQQIADYDKAKADAEREKKKSRNPLKKIWSAAGDFAKGLLNLATFGGYGAITGQGFDFGGVRNFISATSKVGNAVYDVGLKAGLSESNTLMKGLRVADSFIKSVGGIAATPSLLIDSMSSKTDRKAKLESTGSQWGGGVSGIGQTSRDQLGDIAIKAATDLARVGGYVATGGALIGIDAMNTLAQEGIKESGLSDKTKKYLSIASNVISGYQAANAFQGANNAITNTYKPDVSSMGFDTALDVGGANLSINAGNNIALQNTITLNEAADTLSNTSNALAIGLNSGIPNPEQSMSLGDKVKMGTQLGLSLLDALSPTAPQQLEQPTDNNVQVSQLDLPQLQVAADTSNTKDNKYSNRGRYNWSFNYNYLDMAI